MPLEDVNFRDKRFGWASHVESFRFKNSQFYKYMRTYAYTFYTHIMLRYCCGSCPYTNLQHPSDITIADFWGYQKRMRHF